MSYFLTLGTHPVQHGSGLFYDLGISSATATNYYDKYDWNVTSIYPDYSNLTVDDFLIDIVNPSQDYVVSSVSGTINKGVSFSITNYLYHYKSYNPSTGIFSAYIYSRGFFNWSGTQQSIYGRYRVHAYIAKEGEDNDYIVHKITTLNTGTSSIVIGSYYHPTYGVTINNLIRDFNYNSQLQQSVSTSTRGTSNNKIEVLLKIEKDSNSYNSSSDTYYSKSQGALVILNNSVDRGVYLFPKHDLWYVKNKNE